MKITNYLLFLAIYGGITGAMMLFNSTNSLRDYGVNADQYHIAIFQYLGIANLSMAVLIYFILNEISPKVIRIVLLISAIQMMASSIKGYMDVEIQGVPGNTFFWVDASARFVVGLITLFLFFKVSNTQNAKQ